MLRTQDQTPHLSNLSYDQLWEHVSDRRKRQIEDAFLDYLGRDLMGEIDSALGVGSEKHAALGRWLATSWLKYRNEELENLDPNKLTL